LNLNPAPAVDASPTQRGVLSIGTQSIAGAKTFTGAVTIGGLLTANGNASVAGTLTVSGNPVLTTIATGVLLGRSTAGTGAIETLTPGLGLTLAAGVLSTTVTPASTVTTTMAAITLYVATTGNDSADGLTVGTPLRTISAALRKIPFIVEHDCTINLAAGTYDEHITTPRFMLNANITVQGATMTSYTPGTGLSAGTMDGSFGTQWSPQVAVCSTGGWTADTLGGYFLQITSGAATGTIIPICTNTATTLSFGTFVNLAGSTTYDLQGVTFQLVQPATILTNSGATATMNITTCIGASTNNSGNANTTAAGRALLVFDSVAIQKTSGALVVVNDHASVFFNRVMFSGTTAGASLSTALSFLRFDDCGFIRTQLNLNNATSFSGLRLSLNRLVFNGRGSLGAALLLENTQIIGVFIHNAGTSFALYLRNNASVSICTIDGVSTTAVGLAVLGGISSLTNLYIRNCTYGLRIGGSSSTAGGNLVTNTSVAYCIDTVITACGTGVLMDAYAVFSPRPLTTHTTTISNCTSYGINMATDVLGSYNSVQSGGTACFIMTGNAADFTLDGTTTLSLTALRAMTPKRVVDMTNFNRIAEL
jgi:hypothetical protein